MRHLLSAPPADRLCTPALTRKSPECRTGSGAGFLYVYSDTVSFVLYVYSVVYTIYSTRWVQKRAFEGRPV